MHGIAVELISKAGLERPKTHHGLHVLLSKHFIKQGLIEAIYGEALVTVENIRLVADYSADAVPLQDAAKAIDLAEKFVTKISWYISELNSKHVPNFGANKP